MSRPWVVTIPAEGGGGVLVTLDEDVANVHDSYVTLKLIPGPSETGAVRMTLGEFRALYNVIGQWPGVTRG